MGSFPLVGEQGHWSACPWNEGTRLVDNSDFFRCCKNSQLPRAAGSLLIHRDYDKVESAFIKVKKLSVTQLQTQDNNKKAQEIWDALWTRTEPAVDFQLGKAGQWIHWDCMKYLAENKNCFSHVETQDTSTKITCVSNQKKIFFDKAHSSIKLLARRPCEDKIKKKKFLFWKLGWKYLHRWKSKRKAD